MRRLAQVWLALALVALAAAALPAAAQNPSGPQVRSDTGKSDWERALQERDFKEVEVKLPAPPKAAKLIEFFPSAASSFRFFVDADSLSVGADGVVRYTLVARSSSGHDNVTYEGMRCKASSVRVYAYSNAGVWSPAQGDWKPIEARSVQRWHNELRSRYFCPVGVPIHGAAEGLNALRRGGHPHASGSSNPQRF